MGREGLMGMVGVDKIGEIRRAYFEQDRSIKEIVRTLSVSRATVRKVIRSHKTEFKYARGVQPTPKLGDWVEVLTEILEQESKLPKRERRSTQRLFEELRGRGYDGAHDSVHRFVKCWRDERARVPVHAYVPMSFAPGEAYQFDWSQETITLQGLPLTVKAAHMKLSHSRMPFVRVYFRETQELVFDAHDKAFLFYGGVCRRGIYDNMKTAVEAIFVGKARRYNRRFLQMCSHHLIEPVACTPASGWEKGQVENHVGNLRDQMFRPKPRVKSLAELNAWLEDQCIAYARRTKHPEFKDRTIWDAFQDERASLMELRGPFDAFVEKAVRASTTCLIMADHNRYSIDARAAGRMVLVRSHPPPVLPHRRPRRRPARDRAQGRSPPRSNTIRVLLSCQSSTCCIFEVETDRSQSRSMQKQAGCSRFLWGGIEAYFGSIARISATTQVVATLECAAQVSAAATRIQRARLTGSRQTRRAHRARSPRVPRCPPGYAVRPASTPGRSRRGRDPLDLSPPPQRPLAFPVFPSSSPPSPHPTP